MMRPAEGGVSDMREYAAAVQRESAEFRKKQQAERRNKQYEAALWFFAALIVQNYTHFVINVFTHEARRLLWVNIGHAMMLLCIAGTAYLEGYLGAYKRVRDPYEHAPNVVPAMAVCTVICVVAYTYGLWPVWHIFTLPLLGLMFMGVTMPVYVRGARARAVAARTSRHAHASACAVDVDACVWRAFLP